MYTILAFLWQYITHPKIIIALSILVILVSSYNFVSPPLFLALLAVYILSLMAYLIYYLLRRYRNARKGDNLVEAIEQDNLSEYTQSKNKDELTLINQQIKESIQLIRKSKLGDKRGSAALYELPWYMVIGNPAAGKSSAIYHSGLKFPFEESHQKMVSAGLSGTRNCDWFFSTEGVLLDTAGRYSVYKEDQPEWLGFLGLLKKNRSKAPINGLIVVVSTAELVSQSPDKTLSLAKNLRSRIQEITERLEIFAPVYVVFSKFDLIAGFTTFFESCEDNELDQVWGATLAYETASSQNASELFEEHYCILYDGLKSMSTTHLSRRHAQNVSPSVMTFPLEFKSLKPILKAFISTLFEENPYQFKPVFRGFYFTSALQEGLVESPMTQQIAQEFNLNKVVEDDQNPQKSMRIASKNQRYFLKALFSQVILKDKNLVKQHINPLTKRKRYLGFILVLFLVSICLSLWLWSYRNNQQLILDVQADLNKVVQMESTAGQDLTMQFNALLILQQRLQQLDEFDQKRPLKFSFGLYQGNQLRQRLKVEYLKGIQQIVLLPAQQNMAEYLKRVNSHEDILKANHRNVQIQQMSEDKTRQYLEPSDSNPQDAYNALKAYLMLSNRQYIEVGHLKDQVTRFWRPWLATKPSQSSSAETTQKAEQILSYALTLSNDELFPALQANPQLVDQSRQVLLSVIRGMPARDRVYNEIKMRAAVRFPVITVGQLVGDTHKSTVLGGYALPGMFSQKAWDEYVANAIEEAANHPMDTKDWVLNSTQSDDLSFSGSPDQIRQQLTQLYKQEYILQWKKFLSSIHYAKAANFVEELKLIDRLGEPQNSPVRTLMERVAKETSWDNPIVQAELADSQTGFVAWFKRKVLRQGSDLKVEQARTKAQGPISQEFNAFYQLVRKRDDQQNKSLLDEYLDSFAQVRSKFNDLKSSGDMGPNAMLLVRNTINEQNTVFNSTQKIVDEKLMLGLSETEQKLLKKLLLSPLTQAFESLLSPAQDELNKLWVTQVYQPFNQTLVQKYPFNSTATIQATSNEIAQILGETGSISRYVKENLDPLVIRRGYTLSSKTWQDLGIGLNSQFLMDFKAYVAPANGVATGGLEQAAKTSNQSNFQFYPLGNPQLLSYTIDIDGQRMVFENGVQQWVSFVWPNQGAIPGVRITAIDLEGQTHTIFEEPGEYGINRLIDTAQRIEKGGHYEMTWSSKNNPKLAVKMLFRLISGSDQHAVGGNRGYTGLKLVDQVTSKTGVHVVAAQISQQSEQKKSTSMTTQTTPSVTGAAQ